MVDLNDDDGAWLGTEFSTQGFDASNIIEGYTVDSGALEKWEMHCKKVQLTDDANNSVMYKGMVEVEPGAWVEVGNERQYNQTEDTLRFELIDWPKSDDNEISITFGRDDQGLDDPISVGSVQFTGVLPLYKLFEEGFGNALLSSWQPGSTIVTEKNEWTLEYFSDDSVDLSRFNFEITNGFSYDVQSYDQVNQGFRLRKDLTNSRSTLSVLEVDSDLIEVCRMDSCYLYDDNPEWFAGVFYCGIWLLGNDWLWIHLLTDETNCQYPVETPDGSSTSYSTITLGVGEKSLDLSQFSGVLGDEFSSIVIEACAFYLIL